MRSLSSSSSIKHTKWKGTMDNIALYLNLGKRVSQFLKPTSTSFKIVTWIFCKPVSVYYNLLLKSISTCQRTKLPCWLTVQGDSQADLGWYGGASGKEPTWQCRRHKRCGFDPWAGKIPLEVIVATYSSILAWRIPMDGGAWWTTAHRVAKS